MLTLGASGGLDAGCSLADCWDAVDATVGSGGGSHLGSGGRVSTLGVGGGSTLETDDGAAI